MLKNIKFYLAKIFYPYAFIWWKWWSKLYRLLFNRKYRKIKLDENLTYVEASKILEKLKWTPDKKMQLWDVVSSPEWVQYCLSEVENTKIQPAGPLDCDEYACWATNCIDPKFDPRIFCFAWQEDGKLSGHAMCWIQSEDGRHYHIGNWGLYGPYNSIRPACEAIISHYDQCRPIGWALLDKNLNLQFSGRELPDKSVI